MTRDRAKMRESLLKRTEESAARSDSDSDQKYLRAKNDERLPMWKARPTKTEPHLIDVIPYIAGDNFPLDKGIKVVRKGDDAYVLPIAVHRGIGPLKEDIVCPARNYAKPCPICEDIDRQLKDGAEWDDVKDVAAKNRCVYNVLVMDDDKTEAKGIQIWEISYKYSEEELRKQAKNPRGGGYVPFQHPDKGVGKTVSFEVDNDQYWTPGGFKLLDRDYDIPDSILDDAFCLDELIVLLPYEVIKAKYFGTSGDDVHTDDSIASENKEHVSIRNRNRNTSEEKKPDSNNPCPGDGKFGIDIDKLKFCAKDCPDGKYQECYKEADRIEAEVKEKAKKAQEGSGTVIKKRGSRA